MSNPNTWTTDAMKTTSVCDPNIANENLEYLKYESDNSKNIIPQGTCSTASATAEKAVTLSGFTLATGATIEVVFTNANTANVPTLNVNSTGAKAIYNEAGTAVSATNPAYFPAGATVEFTYNGTNWVFKKRVIENYVNGTSWYRVWSDGWIEQGGGCVIDTSGQGTIIFLKEFKNISYLTLLTKRSTDASSWTIMVKIGSETVSSIGIQSNLTGYILGCPWETKGY